MNTTPDGIIRIDTQAQLAQFTKDYGLRPDWHEPDEMGISVRVFGTHLDNAMGPRAEPMIASDGHDFSEHNVVITFTDPGKELPETRDVAVVNLATLLAIAAGTTGQ